MTEQFTNYNTIAPLKNVASMMSLITQLNDRDMGIPGMGVFYGPAGYGKSYAALYAANQLGACVVQCKSTWTAKDLCQAVLFELGGEPKGTCTMMVNRIAEFLVQTDAPLLIDEADVLIKKKSIEVVRDIYESTFSTIILIGEEALPTKLQKWERFHSRVLKWQAARPADAGDLKTLVKFVCPDMKIADGVMADLRTASKGSVRRMVSNLALLRDFAAQHNLDAVTEHDWRNERFPSGDAPAPRRVFG